MKTDEFLATLPDGLQGHLHGQALEQRLAKLSDLANDHHNRLTKIAIGLLDHAYHAGMALEEAYCRLGRRGRWGKWVAKHFAGKARTARVYRQIARNWNNPRLVEARVREGGIVSIAKALRALDGPRSPKQLEQWDRNLHERLCNSAAKLFGHLLSNELLDRDELRNLLLDFERRYWPKIIAILRDENPAAPSGMEDLLPTFEKVVRDAQRKYA